MCVAPPSNLVSWWTGDTDATDRRSGNNGALMNDALAGVPGRVDGAFRFDGTGDFVFVPDSPSLNFGTGNFTIELWFKTSSPHDFSQNIVDKEVGGRGFVILFHGNIIRTFMGDNSEMFDTYSSTGVDDDQWHHLAMVRISNVVNIYIDGVLEGVNSSLLPLDVSSSSNFHIGSQFIGPPSAIEFYRFFKGLIDEVSIYNRALTLQEIQDIYNAGSAGKCKGTVGTGLSFNPDPVAFGAVATGDAATIDLTVTNNNIGTVSCSATAANWTPTGFGVGGFDFAPSSLSIPGPGSAITTVFFTPRRVDTFTMQMKFVCNGAGLENFQKVINVSGTGID